MKSYSDVSASQKSFRRAIMFLIVLICGIIIGGVFVNIVPILLHREIRSE